MTPEFKQADYLDAFALFGLLDVGDLIVLEADILVDGIKVISSGRAYEILVKQEHSPGHPVFLIQSHTDGALIEVHPLLVTNYHSSQTQIQ